MQKNEMIVMQARASAQRFADACRVVRTLLTCGGVVWSIHLIVNGVVEIAKGQPEAISAVAKVVEAFQLDQIVFAFVAIMASTAWWLERRGKKRAVQELGALRQRVESSDDYRSSSRLTGDGSTPTGVRND